MKLTTLLLAVLSIVQVHANPEGAPLCLPGNAGTAGHPENGGPLSGNFVAVKIDGTELVVGEAFSVGKGTFVLTVGQRITGIMIRMAPTVAGADMTGAITIVDGDATMKAGPCIGPADVSVTHSSNTLKGIVTVSLNTESLPDGSYVLDVTNVYSRTAAVYSQFSITVGGAVVDTPAPSPGGIVATDAPTPAGTASPTPPTGGTDAPTPAGTASPTPPTVVTDAPTPAGTASPTPPTVVTVTDAPTPAVTSAPTPAPQVQPVAVPPVAVPVVTAAPTFVLAPVFVQPVVVPTPVARTKPPSRRHDTPGSMKAAQSSESEMEDKSSNYYYSASTSDHTYVVDPAVVSVPDTTTTGVEDPVAPTQPRTSFIQHLGDF